MTRYVEDKTHGAVKIEKENGKYKVYPLDTVYYADTPSSAQTSYSFRWSSTPIKTWNYKPYEEDDVVTYVSGLSIDFIENYAHHKMVYNRDKALSKNKSKKVS